MRKIHLTTTLPEKEALPALKRYTPHPGNSDTVYDAHKPKVVLCIGDSTYALLPTLPNDDAVLAGYLYNKFAKKETLNGVLVSDGKRYPLHSRHRGDIAGYLPLDEENTFAAVTQKDFPGIIFPLPFIFILLLALAIWILPLIHMIGVPVVIYSNDPVVVGSITTQHTEPLETDYFNIKINATPILENGRTNIRIENSARNVLSCEVEITVNLEEGEVVIYHSPRLTPNQSLEYATIETALPQGSYNGIATFHYFNGAEALTTTSSVRLTIYVR